MNIRLSEKNCKLRSCLIGTHGTHCIVFIAGFDFKICRLNAYDAAVHLMLRNPKPNLTITMHLLTF